MSNDVAMFFRRKFLYIAVVFTSGISIGFAGIGDWKNYTNMQNIRAVVADSSSVWAATSGGVFRFVQADSTYQKYTTSEGLTSIDVTAIFIAADGKIWIGEQSGSVDVYDPQKDSWQYISDIKASDKTLKNINGFYQADDNIYISTAFGISVFSVSKFEFVETYTNFVSSLQPNVEAVLLYHGQVIAATSAGIMMSKSGATNLSAPESWTLSSSLTTGNSLIELNGELYAGSKSGLLKFQNGIWLPVAGAGSASQIFGLVGNAISFGELLNGGGNLKTVDGNEKITTIAPFPDSAVAGCVSPAKNVFIGLYSSGVGTYRSSSSTWETYMPNGPHSNSFYQIAVDDNGSVWAASGFQGGNGFYGFDGVTWKNFNISNSPLMISDNCFAVEIGPNNSKWVSTWGGGLLLVDNKGKLIKRYDAINPGFIGDPNNPNYIVPAKISVDNEGNIWTSILIAADNSKVVWKMSPDSIWTAYPGSPYGSIMGFMVGVVIDHNNTKWFTNNPIGKKPESATCAYYNESLFSSNPYPGWGTITDNDGISSTQIQSIAVDKDNNVWIGTASGITIIGDPSKPTSRISQLYLGESISGLFINCITVDPLNNKWLGTPQGVFVVSSDGTQLLQQYTSENTNGKLVDNDVYSIAFDRKKGIAYFGTEYGLSSLEISPISTSPSLSVIDLSPNPIYLPQQSMVQIRGLVDESTIKILSLSGKVIRQFSAQGGGRAFWDCKDSNGNTVGSGVYIIAAHDRDGTQVALGKIAVIRK